jgi:predicted dehydrogenase
MGAWQSVTGRMGVAVVGAGYWGPNLVRNLAASPRFRLRWVCDLDEDRARRVGGYYGGVRTTPRLEDVLDDPEVTAVVVATPAATHAPLGRQVLDAGKHLLLEKPLATTYEDGLALTELAEARGLTLMCDHTYCYTPAVRKIREYIHDGTLGDVQYADSVRINLGLVQPDVTVLWDLAPHDLSILDFVLPADRRPTAIAAHSADPLRTGRACIAFLTLQMPDDAVGHVHVNWLSPHKIRTLVIGGSKRMLLWDDLRPQQRLSLFDRGIDLHGPDLGSEDRREALVSYRTGDMLAPALPEREALADVMEEFGQAIEERRAPLTDGRAGLRVLSALEAAERSVAARGTFVDLRSRA